MVDWDVFMQIERAVLEGEICILAAARANPLKSQRGAMMQSMPNAVDSRCLEDILSVIVVRIVSRARAHHPQQGKHTQYEMKLLFLSLLLGIPHSTKDSSKSPL